MPLLEIKQKSKQNKYLFFIENLYKHKTKGQSNVDLEV